MKINNRLFAYLPALALVSTLGACAGMTPQEKGTATARWWVARRVPCLAQAPWVPPQVLRWVG